MTVTTDTLRTVCPGNGAATLFNMTIAPKFAADFYIIHVDANGAENTLVQDVDYTVDLDNYQVTFPKSGSAYPTLPSGEKIVMLLNLELIQETDIVNQGFYPEVVEAELDRSRQIDQQQQEQIDRAVKIPAGSDIDPENYLSTVQALKVEAHGYAAAAEAARDSAMEVFDTFDDRYLGTYASEPTTDNDGDPLVAGSLFFDSTYGYMKVYTGTLWVAAYAPGTGFLAAANNLNDLLNVATARNNLGLGTAALLNAGTSANNLLQLDGAGKIPAVDGSQITGISFNSLSPTTTAGDIIYHDGSDNVRLAKGSNSDILSLVAGVPEWIKNAVVNLYTVSDSESYTGSATTALTFTKALTNSANKFVAIAFCHADTGNFSGGGRYFARAWWDVDGTDQTISAIGAHDSSIDAMLTPVAVVSPGDTSNHTFTIEVTSGGAGAGVNNYAGYVMHAILLEVGTA